MDECLVDKIHTLFPGQLVVRKNGMPVKPRSFIVARGFASEHSLGVYLHSTDAVVSALSGRFFFIPHGDGYIEPPQPIGGCFRRPNYMKFREQVLSHIPSHFPVMSRDTTVAAFHGPKRRRYEQARDLILRDGLHRCDSVLSAFCKFSKIKVGEHARIISPRNPKWNLELARYVKHLEHKLYRSIHKVFMEFSRGRSRATIMKGLDVDAMAYELRCKWDGYDDPVAVTLDVSKLDACLQIAATKYEHSFYTGVHPRSHGLRWMLRCMQKHHIVARCPDGQVIVKCPGRKASGDVTTAMGDIIVVMAIYFDLFTKLPFSVDIADMGDDACCIMERSDLDQFLQRVVVAFREAGFIIKVENTAHMFEEIVFCQQRPILVSNGWRMVREPKVVVSKDVMCLLHCPVEKTYRKWLGAVALAGRHLCDGVPVLAAFYDCLKRSGRDPGNRLFDRLMQHTHFVRRKRSGGSKIDDTARVSFYHATGILPDAQLILEQTFTNMRIGQLPTNCITFDQLCANRGTQLKLLFL